jgi:hypothetical protein
MKQHFFAHFSQIELGSDWADTVNGKRASPPQPTPVYASDTEICIGLTAHENDSRYQRRAVG